MKRSTPVLILIGIYQAVRFVSLGASVLVRTPLLEDVMLRHGVIALAGGGLIMVVLVTQYIMVPHPVLLTPLRLGKFLETLAAALLFVTLVPNVSIVTVDPLGIIISILLLSDVIVFLFLLLLPRKEL